MKKLREIALVAFIGLASFASCYNHKTPDFIIPNFGGTIYSCGEDMSRTLLLYTVEKGETLSDIARNHSADLDRLAKDNEIEDPNLIYPGQIIRMTCGSAEFSIF